MDEVSLAAAVSRLLNVPCLSLRGLETGFSGASTYIAEFTDWDVIVKVNADVAALARTGRNLEILSDLGVPVPRLLAYDDSGSLLPGAIVIMERFAGRDLSAVIDTMSPAQLTRLAQQIVDIQRTVATLPAPAGCGFVGIGESATRTWTDVVWHPNGYDYANPLPRDAAHLVPLLEQRLAAAAQYFERVVPTAFLDDATTKNVMVHDGELVGIVDLDWICYGDPLFHIGLTAAGVTADAELPVSRHYIDELIRLSGLTDDQRRIVALYEGLFLTNFLVAEWPDKPGPWRRRAVDGAERALRLADG
ncbi:MAG: aminoglycoside phosphotransferase family protein [Mycobacteriales bacterium]